VRLSRILARLDYLKFRQRWIERGELAMVPPPPESDLSYPPSTSSTNNRFANGSVDGSNASYVRFFGLSPLLEMLRITPGYYNAGANVYPILTDPNGNQINFGSPLTVSAAFSVGGTAFSGSGVMDAYNGINTVANGVSSFRGIDDRADVAVVDGSPIVVYSVPVGSTGKVRLSATVVGSSGASISAATYEIKYTVDGAVITKDLSISAVDTEADMSILVAPDASTNITAQVTILTGTTNPKLDVTCLVEAVSVGM
jgi:hypothetical protein